MPKSISINELIKNPALIKNFTTPQQLTLLQALLPSVKGKGAKASIPDNPADFAEKYSEGRWKCAPHLRLISDWLVEADKGLKPRIMVSLPPRNGKSEFISFWYPIWLLARDPTKRILLASYEAEFAAQWGKRVKDKIIDLGERLGISLDMTSAAAHRWFTTEGGGMQTAGVGGPLTGKGADCLPGCSKISTEHGSIDIASLCQLEDKPLVLSFNHGNGSLQWRKIVATRSTTSQELLRITTANGRELVCTKDHRVFTGGSKGWGYERASALEPGMQVVSQDLHEAKVRSQESSSEALCGSLLQQSLYTEASLSKTAKAVQAMWCSNAKEDTEVLRGMQSKAEAQSTRASSKDMWAVPDSISSWLFKETVLQQAVRGQSTLSQDAWDGQFQVQRGKFSRLALQSDETNYQGQGQTVRGLQERGGFGGSPHRRGSFEQRVGESNSFVQLLPYNTSQIQPDTISMVEVLRGERIPVYDIQVEGNSNFFADNVLVHNCLILDDTIKNEEEASSELMRDKLHEWFKTAAFTRLEPGGNVVCLATRWHFDDLLGRLEKESIQADLAISQGTIPETLDWAILKLPALAEKGDQLGRSLDEPLWPSRFPVEELAKIKRQLSPYNWASLYQQNPVPEGGGEIKEAWFKFYQNPPENFDIMVQSWDMAMTEEEKSDFTVGQVWGRKGADLYLLDQVRGRFSIIEILRLVRNFAQKYPKAVAKLIENKALGPAVIGMLQKEIPGIVPIKAIKGKFLRLQGVIPTIAAGNVHLPHKDVFPAILEYCSELSSFPQGTYDDQVDATVQALTYLQPAMWSQLQRDWREAKEGPALASTKAIQNHEFSEWTRKRIRRSQYEANRPARRVRL